MLYVSNVVLLFFLFASNYFIFCSMGALIDKTLSLYLDVLRFLAAVTVVLAHAGGPLTQGLLWQFNWYPDAAVMVFFVMSGFVIAFVTQAKEKTVHDYMLARSVRLWSIIVPALIITFLADSIGLAINEELYMGGPWGPPKIDWLNYLASLFMLNHVWSLGLSPGSNSPFWSLTFELFFYAAFAAYYFCTGVKKYLLILFILAIGGPDIAFLFPIWCLGALAYYSISRRWLPQNGVTATLSFTCLLALLLLTPMLKDNNEPSIPFLLANRNFLADYAYGLLFTGHLVFAPSLLACFDGAFGRLLIRCRRPIVYCASMTFSLYLFHLPLLKMFAAFFDDNGSWQSRIFLLSGTVLFVVTVGRYFELKKHLWKSMLSPIFLPRV
jgi:peptidoglycan/LPS O-acetylase OafA/YrhL